MTERDWSQLLGDVHNTVGCSATMAAILGCCRQGGIRRKRSAISNDDGRRRFHFAGITTGCQIFDALICAVDDQTPPEKMPFKLTAAGSCCHPAVRCPWLTTVADWRR
ncbi:hypothetical protein ACLOJK_022429 [Asimina triloba]